MVGYTVVAVYEQEMQETEGNKLSRKNNANAVCQEKLPVTMLKKANLLAISTHLSVKWNCKIRGTGFLNSNVADKINWQSSTVHLSSHAQDNTNSCYISPSSDLKHKCMYITLDNLLFSKINNLINNSPFRTNLEVLNLYRNVHSQLD